MEISSKGKNPIPLIPFQPIITTTFVQPRRYISELNLITLQLTTPIHTQITPFPITKKRIFQSRLQIRSLTHLQLRTLTTRIGESENVGLSKYAFLSINETNWIILFDFRGLIWFAFLL